MRHETVLFIEAVIREDRSILDFIDAPFTFLNGPLARHYGIPGVTGEEFRRVNLDGEKRSGLLTQGAILTVSSYPTRTSPPVRGKWVLENFLGDGDPRRRRPTCPCWMNRSWPRRCRSLVSAWSSIARIPVAHRATTRWTRSDLGLKATMPLAHGVRMMARRESIHRERYPMANHSKGAKDLKQILRAQSDAFTRNLTEKLLTFALGRGLEKHDGPTVGSHRPACRRG